MELHTEEDFARLQIEIRRLTSENEALRMTALDAFANYATEQDIKEMLCNVGNIEKVVTDYTYPHGQRKRIVHEQPDNARQIARYLHAEAMLETKLHRQGVKK